MQEKSPTLDAATADERAGPAAGERAGTGTLWLFTLTTFLSALLLFAVQPMFAKMVLPVLGGSPSVWAVAMLFFQAALLTGYLYAHLLLRVLPPARTGFVHLALCALAFVVLPIGLPAWFGEPPAGEPYLWQLGLFTVAVGLPFVAVAANAPLLQAWFASTGHRQSSDPYFLYAASNLGSFLALLGYPLVLEPVFGLKALSWYWTFGFALLVAAITVSFLVVRYFGAAAAAAGGDAGEYEVAPAPLRWGGRLSWIGLAMVPSALLTAFTNHVSTDVASAPLIWVVPLALYLLTFVLVFRRRAAVAFVSALMIGVAAAVLTKFAGDRVLPASLEPAWTGAKDSIGEVRLLLAVGGVVTLLFWGLQRLMPVSGMAWMRGIHLVAVAAGLFALSQTRYESWFISATVGVIVFFASTVVAHRTLYEARPAPRHLTQFYLWMSFGGALGGLFAALIAPKIFSEVFEYPILVALTMACRPGAVAGFAEGFRALGHVWRAALVRGAWPLPKAERDRLDELMVLWILLAFGALVYLVSDKALGFVRLLSTDGLPGVLWWVGLPVDAAKAVTVWVAEWGLAAFIAAMFGALLLAAWRHPSRQLAAAVIMCVAVVMLPSGVRRADAERSYFGVYRVYQTGNYNILMHGTTLHGAQKIRDDDGNPVVDTSPTTYYHPGSPMARAVELVRENVTAKGGTGRFGVVGLGTGSLSCHAQRGEKWRIFEIDPVMAKISTDPDNFSYLENCQPKPPDIVIGDARLTLAREPAASFDLVIVDAFSSDAVPIHLMTAESLRLYLDKITANGLAVLHVSNRYLDLDGVLSATSRLVPEAHGIVVSDDNADGGYSATSSTIVVFAKSEDALAPFRAVTELTVSELDNRSGAVKDPDCAGVALSARAGCYAGAALRAAGLIPGRDGLRPWTDDFSDILGPFITKIWY